MVGLKLLVSVSGSPDPHPRAYGRDERRSRCLVK